MGMRILTFKEVDEIRREAVKSFLEDSESVEEHTDLEFSSKKEVYRDMLLFIQLLIDEEN